MSVLIKGMEMPKSCFECQFSIDGYCQAMEPGARTNDNVAQVTNWCPLVEVHTPHGRLIDADELKTAFPSGEIVRTESVKATIDHMPTAEKKGEWIPVSKKKPRLGKLVIVWEQGDYSFARYKITRNGAYFTICESDGYEWDLKADDVDVWCEVPEPYKS